MDTEILYAGDLEIRPAEHLALAGGRALTLSVRELDLLSALARREGRVVPREELYATVWGSPLRADDRSVDVYVHKLRAKLARALPGWRFIHTHFGFGYRFAPERTQSTRKGSMRHNGFLVALALTGALALGVAACGSSEGTESSSGGGGAGNGGSAKLGGSINGAGATFPQPVYQEWAARMKEAQGLTVNYQGIGSGGGIAQFTAGTVDFGATDAPMKDEEITEAKKKGDPVHVPTVLGAVTLSYNVEGLDKGLKLDGATAADIFLGNVEKWNDPKIASANSGMKLPDANITVCHRSDESGTTKNFTEFLADYSPAWKDGPGVDKSVKWPTGTGAKGNDGVAACIKQNDNSIGYVEQAYALANGFTYASVKNEAGQFVEPTLEAASAAGTGVTPPDDLRFSTINAEGDQTYPITAITFLLVYQDMCKAGLDQGKAQRVKAWLDYAIGDGQNVAKDLQYAPLPDQIKSAAKTKVDGLVCNGSAIAGS